MALRPLISHFWPKKISPSWGQTIVQNLQVPERLAVTQFCNGQILCRTAFSPGFPKKKTKNLTCYYIILRHSQDFVLRKSWSLAVATTIIDTSITFDLVYWHHQNIRTIPMAANDVIWPGTDATVGLNAVSIRWQGRKEEEGRKEVYWRSPPLKQPVH